uniref:transport and Golgi organization protein 1 homolog isoform X1 n=1 Tax=Jaculus jaculus TaxID=51337 RepID=UPI001E1B5DA9|nr:transport and Golgi organization protein 1 homolog isoform X1 [Jaculus jaculus]
MAAAPGLLFWLLVLGPRWRASGQQDPGPDPDRRFSEHKLCADDECSMLMYRGEALDDFIGPDCRFVNFKKGDHVYVYYKLAGGSPEVWAGSVGRVFGYFPKDLITVLHKYNKEELRIPADETDFVCFDGGRDDFDNYNVEELLSSLTKESEKTVENVSQHAEKSPDVSKESELDPEPMEGDSGDPESAFSESTSMLQEQFSAQKSHPHGISPVDNVQEEQSSFESFEEILKDKLKVPESENKTSNSSQVTNEQEKIDAYKLLKTEMTLDLKTKFGSTADALVTDDESTRLVTSLEDDFDEEPEAEYYAIENEEEENTDDGGELPLLTLTDEEDKRTRVKPGVDRYSADELILNEENKMEASLPPDNKIDDQNILTTWGDTLFSIVTGGDEKPGKVDLESSSSEEEKEGGHTLAPDSKPRKPQPAPEYMDLGKAEDGLLAEDSKAGDERDSDLDPKRPIKSKVKEIEDSKRLVPDEAESESAKPERMSAEGSLQSTKPSSLPVTENSKGLTLKSAFEKKEHDLRETVIHVSKEMNHEIYSGERREGGSQSEAVPRAVGTAESSAAAAHSGDAQPNASRGGVEDAAAGGPERHTQAAEPHREELKEGPVLEAHGLSGLSSPEDAGLSGAAEESAPTMGRNLSWRQGRGEVAVAREQGNGNMGLSEDQATKDPRAVQDPPEAPDPEVPGVPVGNPEAEEGEFPPEELLEDENAASALHSQDGHSPGIEDRRPGVNLQNTEKANLETLNPDPRTEGNQPEISMFLEPTQESGTAAVEAGRMAGEAGGETEGQEESGPGDGRARPPSAASGLPEDTGARTPGLREGLPSKDPDLQKDSPEHGANTSGLAEKPLGEGSSQEDPEDLMGPGSRGPASDHLAGDEPQRAPPMIPDIVLEGLREDVPIISSFFKDQQPLHRFLKYVNVYELETLLHEMSLRLKSAQHDSLPYNVEKVLDKVFRAYEARILNVAERMVDAQVSKNRDLGLKENDVFEEAAVLDDIQDLIYFVRYKHSGVETAPLITPPPLEEGWAEPIEEVQPPQEDSFSQEITGDFSVESLEEPSLLDQPGASDLDASEMSQNPSIEEHTDPGLFVTEGPVEAGDEPKQLETKVEEPASATPLYSVIFYLSQMLVASLPGDVQPGSDFYGLPWKPVLVTALLGIISFAVFSWRTILAVKSRVYQVTEQQISEKLKTITKENAELEQKLSSYEQKIKESKKHVQETKKQNVILSDEAIKYKEKIKALEETNEVLRDRTQSLRLMLDSEREQNLKNQDLILEKKKSIEKLKDIISMNASELSEVQIALNEAKLSEEKVKSECHRAQEENARLKKKKEQLQQQIEEWSKSHAELSEQIKSCEKSQKDLEVALTYKDDNINALTNCITQLNRLECDLEFEDQSKGGKESDELANGEVGGDRSEKIKNQIKQMMDVSRTQTAVSVVEEDLKLLQLKLRASMSTKCTLEEQIRKLEDDRSSLQTAKAGLEDECKMLRQKVEILNELYQQKEMALQKKLSQEEFERQDREQRLSAADEKVVSAAEEVKTYKRRIEEMEEELQKTERSFKSQIAAHEKKAHDNWLKARAAERAIAEEKREAADLRHKLLEMTQKMAMRQDEPVIVKPMPGRPNTQNPPRRGPLSQNGSFGPSPVSGGECSPPLSAELPGRPLSATLSRRDMPRNEFGSADGLLPRPRWPVEASGKHAASEPGPGSAMNSSSRSSSPAKGLSEGKVNMAIKGPSSFPGLALVGAPLGGPVPPPIRYGPPPQLCGPFGPRPLPPPFVPGMRPPLGLRECAPGILPMDPRGFLPGRMPFRPAGSLGPRDRLPPPAHGPQDCPPPLAARDSLPSGPRDEPPPASQSNSQDCSQALKPSP